MKKVLALFSLLLLFGCDFSKDHLNLSSSGDDENSSTELGVAEEELSRPSLKTMDEFKIPQLIQIESEDSGEPTEQSMSKEEAIEVGAYYIWEVFGWDIDGLYITLDFLDWPSGTRTMWYGKIALSEDQLINRGRALSFIIDSVTGERIDLMNFAFNFNEPDTSDFDLSNPEELEKWRDYLTENAVEPDEEEIERYKDVAHQFLSKHFNQTEVVSVEPHPVDLLNPYLDTLTFLGVDETRREATISIQRETETLFMISTQHNDMK